VPATWSRCIDTDLNPLEAHAYYKQPPAQEHIFRTTKYLFSIGQSFKLEPTIRVTPISSSPFSIGRKITAGLQQKAFRTEVAPFGRVGEFRVFSSRLLSALEQIGHGATARPTHGECSAASPQRSPDEKPTSDR
jgi:hypothetical protein